MNRMAAIPLRIVERLTGQIGKNTIEYWQRYIFYVISLTGIVAGTLALAPSAAAVILKGRVLGGILLIAIYAINVSIIFSPRIPIKKKTLVIAFNFYLFGVASLILAGPEGESGIWFSVSVLLCSLFAGLKSSVIAACMNLLTGIAFGVLHAQGLIAWEILQGFPFHSWLIQSANIFLVDMIFVIANTMLIKGVGDTFRTLNAAEERISA